MGKIKRIRQKLHVAAARSKVKEQMKGISHIHGSGTDDLDMMDVSQPVKVTS